MLCKFAWIRARSNAPRSGTCNFLQTSLLRVQVTADAQPNLIRRWPRIESTKSPCPTFRLNRGKSGMGVRHALFPAPTFGAHLQVAAGFPTLFSTASGVFGLVAGPSSALLRLNFE